MNQILSLQELRKLSVFPVAYGIEAQIPHKAMICVVYNLKELRFRRPGCTHSGHLMLRLRQPSSFCREPPSSPLCLTTTTAPSRLDQMPPLRMSLKFVSASFCSHRTFCNPLLEYLSLFVGEFHCRHLLDASSHGEAWLQDWSFGSHSWH